MASTSNDRYTLSQNTGLTNRIQQLGSQQAKTILDNAQSNPNGILANGVSFAAAAPFAERFLADQGLWAGKMSMCVAADAQIEAKWTDGTGYAAFDGSWDAPISAVLPYIFATFKDVV